MNTPTDFRASLLDLRKQIDDNLELYERSFMWITSDAGSPEGSFNLGNWRIVPRFPENTPSEPPEASSKAFDIWWECEGFMNGNPHVVHSLRHFAWEAWQASRAQLNSPTQQ